MLLKTLQKLIIPVTTLIVTLAACTLLFIRPNRPICRSMHANTTHLSQLIDRSIYKHYHLANETNNNSVVLEQFMERVEKIYILCIECEVLQFRLTHRNKTIVVDGTIFDKYTNAQGHLMRVTKAHQAIVSHAAHNQYSSILVLEDDVVGTGVPPLNAEEMETYMAASSRAIVRVNYRPYWGAWGLGGCQRACMYDSKHALAEVQPGCELHSSSAYVLSYGMYERFLNTRGVIDVEMMMRSTQVLVIPLAAAQRPPKYEGVLERASEFYKRCDVQHTNAAKQWLLSLIPTIVGLYKRGSC